MPETMTKARFLDFKVAIKFAFIGLGIALSSACTTTTPSNSSVSDHTVKPIHTNSNDIWQRIRDNYGMPDLYNNEVLAKEAYYSTRADYVGRMAERSGDFLYIIMNEIERRHMPSELALLPFVESAFVTTAKSPVKAAGLWQFMPATGRQYSLEQNRFADQRNDVVASTNAALTYLQKLHDQFGDWHLALAAYNWGEGNVGRAVNRSGGGGYQDIKMPTETRQYVPKLQAIKNIVSNPALYGIELPNIHNSVRHEAITITRDIDMRTAAQLAHMSEDEFKRINPAYKNTVIVSALGSKILVPTDRADDFRAAFSDHSRRLATLTTYTTYSPELLADIANKYDTDDTQLRYLNNIPYNHSYVQAGSTLIVPRVKSDDEIPYLALNSSVRTSTGDVGFTSTTNTGMNSSDPKPYASPFGTLTDLPIATGIVETNSNFIPALIASAPAVPAFEAPTLSEPVITTPIVVPPTIEVTNTSQTTKANEVDRLTQLINNPPPIYDVQTNTPISSPKDADVGLSAKDLPDNIIASDPNRVQVLPTSAQDLKTVDMVFSPDANVRTPSRLENPPLADSGLRVGSVVPKSQREHPVIKTNNNQIKKTESKLAQANKTVASYSDTQSKSKLKNSKNITKAQASIKDSKPSSKAKADLKTNSKQTSKSQASKKTVDKPVTKPVTKSAAKASAKAPAKSAAKTPVAKPTTKSATKPSASKKADLKKKTVETVKKPKKK